MRLLDASPRFAPIGAALAAVIFFAPLAAWGGDAPQPPGHLEQLEQQLKEGVAERDKAAAHAAEVAREAETLRNDMIAAASAVQEREEALSDLEQRLTALDAEQRDKSAALDLKRQQMNGVITALARLAYRPSESLIGQPTSPTDTVRSAILLRLVVPELRAQVAGLRADLDSVAAIRQAIGAQKEKIARAASELDTEHRHLAALYAKKSEARQQAETERHDAEMRLASLASEAQDLRDLLARIDQDRQAQAEKEAKPPPADAEPRSAALVAAPRSFSHAQGQMPMPARGRIAIHFGQTDENGQAAKGISIETRPGAQVVAPFDGQVAFAGPFRGYGLLLIIEHAEGYHTLLAGMARIDSTVGQRLVAGEPVGVMSDSEEKPLLYVELRRQGQPINPLPWLTARKSKVIE